MHAESRGSICQCLGSLLLSIVCGMVGMNNGWSECTTDGRNAQQMVGMHNGRSECTTGGQKGAMGGRNAH